MSCDFSILPITVIFCELFNTVFKFYHIRNREKLAAGSGTKAEYC